MQAYFVGYDVHACNGMLPARLARTCNVHRTLLSLQGDTALHLAVAANWRNTVAALLSGGANPSTVIHVVRAATHCHIAFAVLVLLGCIPTDSLLWLQSMMHMLPYCA